MIQVCDPPRTRQVRRLSAEEFCRLAQSEVSSVYRPRSEVLRMLTVGEVWGVYSTRGVPGAGCILLPMDADVAAAAALRRFLGWNRTSGGYFLRTIMVFNHFLRAIARKCAIINNQLAYCSVRMICSGKQNRICAILNRKSAISNGSLIPVHDNVLGSVAKCTTINRQDTTLTIFYGIKTTAKITIFNSEMRFIIALRIATIANCTGIATTIFDRSIIDGHRSTLIIKDGITAITAIAIWA